MMKLLQEVFLISALISHSALVVVALSSFSPCTRNHHRHHHPRVLLQSTFLSGGEKEATTVLAEDPSPNSIAITRRALLGAATIHSCLIGGCICAVAQPTRVGAAENETPSSTTATTATIYKSGKTPIVPGEKPKDKNDVRGTRKDPDFLRSVADCRSQCQNSVGSDGYARSKEDCLSECQDICCKTYEQCTFDIVPRI